jgi:phosphoribosylformylglycinamidine synthase
MPLESKKNSEKWHVHVRRRSPSLDGHGRDVLAEIRQLGLEHVEDVRSSRFYFFSGSLADTDVELLASSLLTDPVAEMYTVGAGLAARTPGDPAIEIHTLPGVTNPTAMSALEASRRLLKAHGRSRSTISEVQTARRYELVGTRDAHELSRIAEQVLANDCIEKWYIDGHGRSDPIPDDFPIPPEKPFELCHVPLSTIADEDLEAFSRDAHLFLSLEEMRAIRAHFVKLDRDPTDLELETLAQTWSEHCVHKTLKSAIDYRGEGFGEAGEIRAEFGNLLKETIVAATETLDKEWCLSVFVDNAGVIAFDEEFGLAFKVETHNHPSAIEPYGGAATGIGGCIRDIMGCGLGAKPIASTDVFCLAPPDFDAARLPKDVLHPRRVLKGVVRGVRDYGNRMGIPTVNGALYFDERFVANPLVFCGCIGLIPRNRIEKEVHPGDMIVVAGGRTGRDGIHGATFSSAELTDTHADEFSHAVQIGHAIEEKKVLDALLLARDHETGCLYSAVTDCGAGGLSSAVGEMGESVGAQVDLEKVPLKYSGLRYDEIWISEAQERMVFSVPPDRLETMLALFEREEVEATVIGRFTGDGVLRVRFDGQTVGELGMEFLHKGYPKTKLSARWHMDPAPQRPGRVAAGLSRTGSATDQLLAALGELNTASKEWVIRQYDHEVQGRTAMKSLVGPGFGPSDAAVMRPQYESRRGAVVGCGMCPELGDVDPYWMAVGAVDEALRNIICAGADPHHAAILDNFCWPKVDTEESLGALVRTCRGAMDVAIAYGLPFISGKDSLNNEFSMSAAEAQRTGLSDRLAIPYTLLVSALGLVDDVRRCVSMDFKLPGSVVVVASAPVTPLAESLGERQSQSKKQRFDRAVKLHHQVSRFIQDGKVRSAHDVSDGGLAVAIAEMCIASNLGATVEINADKFDHPVFADVSTTYVLEMSEEDAQAAGLPIIGQVVEEPRLNITLSHSRSINATIADLAQAWRAPLAQGGGR